MPTTARPLMMRSVIFKIGTVAYECWVRAVTLTPDTPIQEWETLCPDGAGQEPGKTKWSLSVEYYQDWAEDTFASFLAENAGQTAAFEFAPTGVETGADNPKWSGDVVVVPGTVGGTVNEFATATVDLPVIGVPTMTRPTA